MAARAGRTRPRQSRAEPAFGATSRNIRASRKAILQLLALWLAFELIDEAGLYVERLLLLAALAARRDLLTLLRPIATTLLSHLSLLFAPAGVA
ncbi:MAG: hypothetical protein N3D71_09395 [Burkholderiaceae bacterium]|nr:hypothetical protein [Burkholderiaceae bacterium]